MNTSLRILILNYEYPPLGGGAGIVTKHLAERFALKGHDVHVITAWFPGQSEYSSGKRLTVIRLKSRRTQTFKSNPIEMYSWARHAINYFKSMPEEKNFDVCLANFTLPGGLVAKYIKKRWDIPYVILSHGHDIPWFAPKQMMPWHVMTYFWIKKVMRLSYANIVLTEELKAAADKFIQDSHKNIVIPNGMLMDDYKSGFNRNNEPVQVLFVGRMVEQKDPITFIRACKKINDLRIPAQFTMIGDGPLKLQVEKMTMQLDIRNIEIMGQVSHYDVLKTYEKADVLIMPSREEAMSMVVLEAVSRGVYVIATTVSGTTSLIEDNINGNLIEFGNSEQVSLIFKDFYYNKYRKNYQYPDDMINKLFKRYSWDVVVNQYLDVLQKAMVASTRN